MSRLLLNLRQVPEDEADEVRELLQARGIAFYETQAGRWNLSLPGIWVEDDDYAAALQHLSGYQVERLARARAEQVALREAGQWPGFGSVLRQHPLRVLLVLAAIAGILMLMLWPYFGF